MEELQFQSEGRLLAEFLLLGRSVFSRKAFSLWDEAHPHDGGQSDLNVNLI